MTTITNGRNISQPLDRRPEARTFSVQDLLDEVSRGKVRIPSFQRGLRWKREDAKRLLDSLYRGYPVGTLLFWETAAPADKVHFGSLSLIAPERSDALWIVDGQQRIVSLARTLLPVDPDEDEFALYFDLDEAEFTIPPSDVKRDEDHSRWLPMTEVVDSERLLRWLLDHASGNKDRREKAIQLGRRVREYDIPAYIVRSDDEGILRDVFNRINNSGKKLDEQEVFDALNGARSESRPATILQISSELERLDFGHVEEKILYRLLRALQGWDVTKGGREETPRLDADKAAQAYAMTVEAAKNVILFLKVDADIPHYDLLPYKQPFVTLGKFFHHHPAPSPRSRSLLARWIWRGALNAAHRGDTVSTRQALDRVIHDNEEMSVHGMLEMVKQRPTLTPEVPAKFNFRFANSKLFALAMIAFEPRDLETGARLETKYLLHKANSSEDETVLPQIITSGNTHLKSLMQSTANRIAHPFRPGLRQLLMSAAVRPDVLLSHGITPEAIDALRSGDIHTFLVLRSEWLQPKFFSYFSRQARWEESDRPAIESLVVIDEVE